VDGALGEGRARHRARRDLEAHGVTARLVAWLDRHATRVVVALTLFYVALELLYVSHLPLIWDEFQGAWSVDQFRSELPYRDFRPYKTVLGYYLQLVPRSLPLDLWSRLMAVKIMTIVLNGASIAFGALWMIRRYRPAAVCLSTLTLVCMSTFLERSAELRVDMLTGWVGFFGLLLLLDGRVFWAGVLAALSFLVSQKGVYYMACGALAVAVAYRWHRAVLEHGVGLVAPIALYVGAWSLVSSLGAVIDATFFSHGKVAFTTMYENLGTYWRITLETNPLFWASAAAALGVAWIRRRTSGNDRRALVLLVYGGVLGILGALHKQPWPYFFVILIPTAWVLGTVFFDAALEWRLATTRPALLLYVALAVAFPLLLRIPKVIRRDNGFQRQAVTLAEAILQPGDTYLAGVELVPTHRQAAKEFAWLDKNRKQMLSTINLDRLIGDLDRSPPKLLVWSVRLEKLPEKLDAWLRSTFTPFSSNVWLYAPTLDSGEADLTLHFAGSYRVLAPADVRVTIDGRTLESGERIDLRRGVHRVAAPPGVRLQLTPEVPAHLVDPRWSAPEPFFSRPYAY
jgi:hypothetical protein